MSNICGKVKKGKGVFHSSQIWKHNGLMGQVKRAQIAMQAVYDAETTTEECRALAAKLEGQITVLFNMLHTRRDQQTSKARSLK